MSKKMFLVAKNDDGFWISERTEEGFAAMESSDFQEYPERWAEWKSYDSIADILKELENELRE